jgi:PepSY-associated TM region
MTRPTATILRLVIFLHRWMGVALSLIFLLWFLSGIVLMYRGFPYISEHDRLEHLPELNPATVKISPSEAFRILGNPSLPSRTTLSSFDGRPVYRFQYGVDEALIYADDGSEQLEVSPEMVRRIARNWAVQDDRSLASNPIEEEVTKPDQWTVQASLDSLRPFWKYSFPDGLQIYVSSVTGEVVQASTTSSRFWAYMGPIPHWLYFTSLRIHGKEWSNTVIWSSGIGTLASLLGMIIGVWMYSPKKGYLHHGQPSTIPYSGQKRLHTIVGLLFGLFACTWAFSGMLSMDPFPTNTGGPSGGRGKEKNRGFTASAFVRIPAALRDDRVDMAAFSAKHPREALLSAANAHVKELALTTVTGEPMYVASAANGQSLFIPLSGAPFREFDATRVVETMTRAASPAQLEIRELRQYDAYYLDRRREKPLPVLLVTEKASRSARYYVDPKTARVVGNYSSERWMSRWLYHGLHSLDFPWLYNHRPLWDIVVLTLMLGGCFLCVTSLILAWQVLLRKTIGS